MDATTDKRSDGFDLLRLGPIRSFILWRGFPYLFQALMLLFFLALAFIAWGHDAPVGVNGKLYAKTNLTTLLIWGVWWPAMIWIAVLFGRAWCMICPLELVSNLSERLGRWLGIRQRPLRRWMISGIIIVALYALIQFLVAGAHINRVPAYTALFLIGLLTLSFVTGLIFKDRAFCRGFCPVGLLLATYGRGGMLAVRAGSTQTCGACTGKDCIMACNRTRLDARSCPSLLNPPRLNSNRDCLVCAQCIKSCQPDNMRLLLRRPFPPQDVREPLASWPTTLFVMLASGFVTWELFTEWPRGEEVFLTVPHWISGQAGISWLSGYLNGVWSLIIVPLIIWIVMGGAVRLLRDHSTISHTWRRLALPLAVIVSAGHMTKGLAKFVSWVEYLPYALKDPVGSNTVLAMSNKTIPQPASLLSLPVVAVVGVILVLVGLSFAIREARLAHPETISHHRHIIPKLGLATAFLCIIFGWAFV
jgi:hypothetical protein